MLSDNAYGTGALLRYRVWILVEGPDGEGAITFNAYGPALPRVGERLNFNGKFGDELSVVVTEIDHTWFRAGESTRDLGVTVAAELTAPRNQTLAVRLMDDIEATAEWVGQFAHLEAMDWS